MNLLMVTFAVPRPAAVSGGSLVMYGQLRALASRHAITVLTFAPAAKDAKSSVAHLESMGIRVDQIGGRWPAGVIRWKRRADHAVQRLLPERPNVGIARVDPAMQRRIDQLTVGDDFDLLHVESIGFGGYTFGRRLPSVLVEHEAGRETVRDWRVHQPATWRQFDRIQVFTPRDRATIGTVVPDLKHRVRINPFGIDVPPQIDTQRDDPGMILFVGGFRHPPNVAAARMLANDIMPLLRTTCPGIRAELVGSHPPREVRRLASADVIVRGDVPSVEPYLRKAAVVVAPIETGGGMRVKILQAMAMGKAVVTTTLGAEGVASAPDRPLIVVDDIDEMAREIARLLANADERRLIGSRARPFVLAHHTWEAYSRRLESIYEEAVAERRMR